MRNRRGGVILTEQNDSDVIISQRVPWVLFQQVTIDGERSVIVT